MKKPKPFAYLKNGDHFVFAGDEDIHRKTGVRSAVDLDGVNVTVNTRDYVIFVEEEEVEKITNPPKKKTSRKKELDIEELDLTNDDVED